ncbi:hypothetical protein KGP36_03190 [Patescibacteria group bacterium]|nr:hypothetical protein [Patescibacteria group bacterium]
MRMKTREELVQDFMDATDNGTDRLEVSIKCFIEEVDELSNELYNMLEAPLLFSRENLVKELADVQYVLSQLANALDVDLDQAFIRVHESNMTKTVDGKVLRREDGKILKPDTYVAPDLSDL